MERVRSVAPEAAAGFSDTVAFRSARETLTAVTPTLSVVAARELALIVVKKIAVKTSE
jgi:hypothetical protein